MIVDVFENAHKYYCLHKRFERAFEYIFSTDFEKLPCGRYEIDGNDIYANVDEYETKEDTLMEFHKKYIDIQFMVQGEEFIGYHPFKNLEIMNQYQEALEVGFGVSGLSFIEMKPGMFMIMFPDDAHQPRTTMDEPHHVKKVVVKIKVD